MYVQGGLNFVTPVTVNPLKELGSGRDAIDQCLSLVILSAALFQPKKEEEAASKLLDNLGRHRPRSCMCGTSASLLSYRLLHSVHPYPTCALDR